VRIAWLIVCLADADRPADLATSLVQQLCRQLPWMQAESLRVSS